tara:strand:+ start:467 stop:724 length:258 start_codon:yes stop_codon:yes gene_type:complete
MIDTITEKNLKKVTVKDYRERYKMIMDNCSEYLVKHNGNKHWLAGTMILTEWKNCLHSNPFESWNLRNKKDAKDAFEQRNFNEAW